MSVGNAFKKTANWVAARLPRALARHTTHKTHWYANNHHFKFEPGQELDFLKSHKGSEQDFRLGWVVEGHRKGVLHDEYAIKAGDEVLRFRKRMIKSQFRPVGKPGRPGQVSTSGAQANQL